MKIVYRVLISICTAMLFSSCSINIEDYYGLWTDDDGYTNLLITPNHLMEFYPEHSPDIMPYSIKGRKILVNYGAYTNEKLAKIDNLHKRIFYASNKNPLLLRYSMDELNCLTGENDYDYHWVLGEWEGTIYDSISGGLNDGKLPSNKLKLLCKTNGFRFALGKDNYCEDIDFEIVNLCFGCDSIRFLIDPVYEQLFETKTGSRLSENKNSKLWYQVGSSMLVPGGIKTQYFPIRLIDKTNKTFSFPLIITKITDNAKITYAKALCMNKLAGFAVGASLPERYDYYSDRDYERAGVFSGYVTGNLMGSLTDKMDNNQLKKAAQGFEEAKVIFKLMGIDPNAEIDKIISCSAKGTLVITLPLNKEGVGKCTINIVAPENYSGTLEMPITAFQKSQDESIITYTLGATEGNKQKLSFNVLRGKVTLGNLSFNVSLPYE